MTSIQTLPTSTNASSKHPPRMPGAISFSPPRSVPAYAANTPQKRERFTLVANIRCGRSGRSSFSVHAVDEHVTKKGTLPARPHSVRAGRQRSRCILRQWRYRFSSVSVVLNRFSYSWVRRAVSSLSYIQNRSSPRTYRRKKRNLTQHITTVHQPSEVLNEVPRSPAVAFSLFREFLHQFSRLISVDANNNRFFCPI